MTSTGLNCRLLEVKELGNIKVEGNKYVFVLFEVRKKKNILNTPISFMKG